MRRTNNERKFTSVDYDGNSTIPGEIWEWPDLETVRAGRVIGAVLINVRDKPSRDGVELKKLRRYAPVSIIGEEGEYFKINLSKSDEEPLIGFIHKDFCEVI